MNRLIFEATNRCNLRCKHCLRDTTQRGHDLSVPLLERVLRQARDYYRVQFVGLTGGEPLLHPELCRILEVIAERDYIFTIVTNGLLVPQYLELFKRPEIKPRIEHISVSLDGPDAETHDAIRGPGTYKKAMRAFLMLKAAGIPAVLKYAVGRHNIDSLERAVMELCHLEPKRIEIALILPTPDNMAAGLIPSPAEYRQAASLIFRLSQELKTPILLNAGIYVNQSFFTCTSLSMLDVYIDAKGRLGFCCILPGISSGDGRKGEPEAVADLAETDLCEAHKRLLSLISGFQRKRIDMIRKGELDETDHFQCIACLRYFKKMEWLDSLPDNPWSRCATPREGKK